VGADRADHRVRELREIRFQIEYFLGRRQSDDGPAGSVVHPLVIDHVAAVDAERRDDLLQVLLFDFAAAESGWRGEEQCLLPAAHFDQARGAFLHDLVLA